MKRSKRGGLRVSKRHWMQSNANEERVSVIIIIYMYAVPFWSQISAYPRPKNEMAGEKNE